MRWLVLLLPALLLGCQSGPDSERAARAAEIASQITQDPANAELILLAADVDPAEYQDWLHEIAADPVETRIYLSHLQVPPENPYQPDGHSTPRPSAHQPPAAGEMAP